MVSQTITALNLVESRQSEANTIINTIYEDGSISGNTERISTPELNDIVAGICSRNHKFALNGTVEEAKMDNNGSFTQFASSTGESEVGKDTFASI